MRVRWLVISALVCGLALSSVSSVAAANPTITPSNTTIPFGQTSVTIDWNTGDGSFGQVWFEFNQTGERLFGQGATGHQDANFIGNAGYYYFRLYKGSFASSPRAQGVFPITQTSEFKAGPGGYGGAQVIAVQPNPDGSAPTPQGTSGGFTSGPRGQILGSTSSPPGFEDNLPVTATGAYPRRVYLAFDAGTLGNGSPRPAANVNVAPPAQGMNPTYNLFTQGPYGVVPFDYVEDGSYSFTLTDTATGLGLSQYGFNTRAGVVTDKTTYSGGAAAVAQLGFDSNTGSATLVCASNATVGGSFANNGTIVSYSNNGGGHATLTGLPPSAAPYTLGVYLLEFASGPQFITGITGAGQNCGTGTNNFTTPPMVTNGTAQSGNPLALLNGSTTITITP